MGFIDILLQNDCITNPTIVYCGIELFNKFSDRLTLAISSKTTTELDDVMKVNVKCVIVIVYVTKPEKISLSYAK